MPGISHHFEAPSAKGKEWNQNHPGLGLERSTPWKEDFRLKVSAGVMKDSIGDWGKYAGASIQRRYSTAAWHLDLGAGLFLVHRKFNFGGEKRLALAPLPVASLEHRSSGVGLNLSYVPHFTHRNEVMPAVAYLQLFKRF